MEPLNSGNRLHRKAPSARWHSFRFSLRSVAIIFSILCVFVSFYGRNAWHARQQKATVYELRKAGVHVDYTESPNEHQAWKLGIFGHDYLSQIEGVLIYRGELEPGQSWRGDEGDGINPAANLNAIIAKASHLNPLDRIRIENVTLTEQTLFPLERKPKLTWLSLCGTNATDQHLTILNYLPKLKVLDLRRTEITDDCVDILLSLRQLQHLWLENTQLSQAALLRLKSNFPDCEITSTTHDELISTPAE